MLLVSVVLRFFISLPHIPLSTPSPIYLFPSHGCVDMSVGGGLVESKSSVLNEWQVIQVQLEEMLPEFRIT